MGGRNKPDGTMAFVNGDGFWSWRNFFLLADKIVKLWERFGSRGIRTKAIRRAERWILERTRYSGGLAAIYPAMMYAVPAESPVTLVQNLALRSAIAAG